MRKSLLPIALIFAAHPATGAAQMAAKVIGGSDANEAPAWVAGLHDYNPDTSRYSFYPFCGGSLIAPGWVVTAAHCLVEQNNEILPADRIILRLDRPFLGDPNSQEPQPDTQPDHLVSQLFINPAYSASKLYDSDIALLQLEEKVTFSPVSLADEAIMTRLSQSTLLDDVVQILGWGIYDNDDFDPDKVSKGPQPEMLQQARIDYLPFQLNNCRNSWGGLTPNMICAWERDPPASSPNGQDACFGDSGGPLLLPRHTLLSDGEVSADWLLGATSFGSSDCDGSQPGVYTRLASFTGWIEQVSAGSEDPLVDGKAQLTMSDVINPTRSFTLQASLINASHANPLSGGRFKVTTSTDVTLSPGSEGDCEMISGQWHCIAPTPLAAGAPFSVEFEGHWNSGINEAVTVISLTTSQDQDDYRVANNATSARIPVSESGNPVLDPFNTLSQRNTRATLSLTAHNASTINTAQDATITLNQPSGLSINTGGACQSTTSNTLTCPLGDMLPLASASITLELQGNGTFTLEAILTTSNGDYVPGDTQRSTTIRLRSASSGTLALWPALTLLLYRRLKRRSQTSN
jgi:secreted trypsin-like serine protease